VQKEVPREIDIQILYLLLKARPLFSSNLDDLDATSISISNLAMNINSTSFYLICIVYAGIAGPGFSHADDRKRGNESGLS
jgi:hypothetical protein